MKDVSCQLAVYLQGDPGAPGPAGPRGAPGVDGLPGLQVSPCVLDSANISETLF